MIECLVLQVVLSLFSVSAQEAPHIVYFGDSITEGWMDSELHPEYGYPMLVDSLFRTSNKIVQSINRSHAGETTEDALQRIDRDVLAIQPDLVVIAFGSNDWYIHGYARTSRVSLVRFQENVKLLCQKLRGTGIRFVLMELPKLLEERFYSFSPRMLYAPYHGAASLRGEYNQSIRTIGQEFGIPSISCEFDSVEAQYALGVDGVHLTPRGHQLIAQRLFPIVKELLNKPAPVDTKRYDVTLYPNPLRDRCILRAFLPEGAEVRISVFDQRGRLLNFTTYFPPLSGFHYIVCGMFDRDSTQLPAGAYILTVSGAINVTKHIIIQ